MGKNVRELFLNDRGFVDKIRKLSESDKYLEIELETGADLFQFKKIDLYLYEDRLSIIDAAEDDLETLVEEGFL